MHCCRFFARRTLLQMADELTLATAPTSKRFPTTNQAKACYMCAAARLQKALPQAQPLA